MVKPPCRSWFTCCKQYLKCQLDISIACISMALFAANLDDLDFVSYIGGVSVTIDPGYNGYIISPSNKAALIKEKANDFLSTYQPQIENLL